MAILSKRCERTTTKQQQHMKWLQIKIAFSLHFSLMTTIQCVHDAHFYFFSEIPQRCASYVRFPICFCSFIFFKLHFWPKTYESSCCFFFFPLKVIANIPHVTSWTLFIITMKLIFPLCAQCEQRCRYARLLLLYTVKCWPKWLFVELFHNAD